MIHIVGLGGVGFWLTVGLSQSVPPDQLHCWDDDTLAGGTGATRLPWGPETTKKTDLLRGYLTMVHGLVVLPQCSDRKFSGLLHVSEGDTVVDCTDMSTTQRRAMWSRARNKGARVLRVSYDGQGSMIVASTGLPLGNPEAAGYTARPSLALSFAAGGIGAEIVRRYIANPVEHFTLCLSVEEAMK